MFKHTVTHRVAGLQPIQSLKWSEQSYSTFCIQTLKTKVTQSCSSLYFGLIMINVHAFCHPRFRQDSLCLLWPPPFVRSSFGLLNHTLFPLQTALHIPERHITHRRITWRGMDDESRVLTSENPHSTAVTTSCVSLWSCGYCPSAP